MGKLVFSETGVQVHLPDPSSDPNFQSRGDNGMSAFGGRLPILYNDKNRQAYVGGPNWYHGDVSSHHGLNTFVDDYHEGYVGGGPDWANGNLEWYADPPADHPEVAKALVEAGIPVPNVDKGLSRWNPEAEAGDDLWEDDAPAMTAEDLDFWHP